MSPVVSNRGFGRNATRHTLTYGGDELHAPAPSKKRAYAAQRRAAELKSKFQSRSNRRRTNVSESSSESNCGDEEDCADGESESDEDFGETDDSDADTVEPRAWAPSDATRQLQRSRPTTERSHQTGLIESTDADLQSPSVDGFSLFESLDQSMGPWDAGTAIANMQGLKTRESIDLSSSDDETYRLLEMMSDGEETDGAIEMVENMAVIEDVTASGDLDQALSDAVLEDNDGVFSMPTDWHHPDSDLFTSDFSPIFPDMDEMSNTGPVTTTTTMTLDLQTITLAESYSELMDNEDCLSPPTGLLTPSLSSYASVVDDPDVTDDEPHNKSLTISGAVLTKRLQTHGSRRENHSSIRKRTKPLNKPKLGRFKVSRERTVMTHGKTGNLVIKRADAAARANASQNEADNELFQRFKGLTSEMCDLDFMYMLNVSGLSETLSRAIWRKGSTLNQPPCSEDNSNPHSPEINDDDDDDEMRLDLPDLSTFVEF